MKSLVNGCAAAALLLGLASASHAEIVVRDAPVHAVPSEDEGGNVASASADEADDVARVRAAPLAPKAEPAAEAPRPARAQPAKVEAAETIQAAKAIEAVDEGKAEPAPVKALIHPKAPPAAALTPDEDAFFAVLGQRVTDAASAYESYVRRAGAIDPAFTGGTAVRKAVTAGAAYQPQQLEEGVIAYAALVALRNPAFVDGVRAMRDPAFAGVLEISPDRVLQVPGAAEAAADAAGVLRAQGAALSAAGKAITKAAYDIQSQSWSKNPEADPQAMLQGAKDSAEQLREATVPSKERLLASLVAAPQASTAAGSGAPDVVRGLALAALAILGRTGDGQEGAYERLLHDTAGVNCLKEAKMNLNQCLAVAGPHYEDVYCAGRHAVSDTGKCITEAATGADLPAPPQALPPARLQQAVGYGYEQAEAYGQAPPARAPELDDDDAAAAPRYAAPAQGYARNDYAPPQPQYQQPAYAQPQQPQYQPSPQYPQQQAYAAQGYQGQGYQGQASYQGQAYAAPQGYYQPYGYAARGYYGR